MGGRSSKSDLRALRCCEGGWGQAGPSAPGRLQGEDALQGTTSHLVGKGLSWWGMPWQGRDAGPGHIQQCTGGDSCWAFRSQLRGTAPQTGLVSTFQGLAAVPTAWLNGSS